MVIETLRELDQVAYVRFASVYREFSDVSEFVDTLRQLSSKKTKLKDAALRLTKRKELEQEAKILKIDSRINRRKQELHLLKEKDDS